LLNLPRWRTFLAFGTVVSGCALAGCTTQGAGGLADGLKTASLGKTSSKASYAYTAKDKECLARAMFFESNRSSRSGLVAVGTVVMNRLDSGEYGDTVCQVVGQKGQFAPGVLSRKMNSKALPDVVDAADSVLKGERHPKVKNAMFFHTAGLRFPYKNMHYVLEAGGNEFYEKRSRRRAKPAVEETQVAEASPLPGVQETTQQAAAPAETRIAMTENGPRVLRQSARAQDSAPVETQAASPARSARVAAAQNGRSDDAAPVETAAGTTGKGPRLLPQAMRPEASAPQIAETAPSLPAEAPQPSEIPQTAMSYEADPKAVDAIGAMIASQSRPMPAVE
jgi:hypothetical protein